MKELSDLSKKSEKECNSLCRKVVYAILAIAWGLMIKDGKFIAETQGQFLWTLGCIYVLSVIYLLVDAGTYYIIGSKARTMMKRLDDDHDDLTPIEAINNMNTVMDYAYGTLAYKLIACLILVILLAIYVYQLGLTNKML